MVFNGLYVSVPLWHMWFLCGSAPSADKVPFGVSGRLGIATRSVGVAPISLGSLLGIVAMLVDIGLFSPLAHCQ